MGVITLQAAPCRQGSRGVPAAEGGAAAAEPRGDAHAELWVRGFGLISNTGRDTTDILGLCQGYLRATLGRF